jgi:hypothetical protein
MEQTGPLDLLPLPAMYLLTSLFALMAVEAGFRLAKRRLRRELYEKEASVGAMIGATMGQAAFLLAFTFGLAASRFDARKAFVVDEANAIGTTYYRAALLSEPQSSQIRRLLREYVRVRLQLVHPERVEQALQRSDELHASLWSQAVAAVDHDHDRGPIVALFIGSLNEMMDLHTKRLELGLRNRLPASIWMALYAVAVVAMFGVGYHAGVTGTRRSPMTFVLVLTFAAVIVLIADLDRPYQGLLQVSQEAILDLERAIGP